MSWKSDAARRAAKKKAHTKRALTFQHYELERAASEGNERAQRLLDQCLCDKCKRGRTARKLVLSSEYGRSTEPEW